MAKTTPCLLLFGLALASLSSVAAAEVDFSCMSLEVRGKHPLTDRYKEYDLMLQNRCPGPVYWTMCIERIDPVSHRIIETLNPAGVLEQDKNSRVNLQMKVAPPSMDFRSRYQEFYVGVGYAIKPPARAACSAAACEAERRELRSRFDTNLQAWEAAEDALAAALAAECPDSGWGKTEESEACEANLREQAQPELEEFAAIDEALRAQLMASDTAACALHGGDLFEYP